MKLKNKRTGNLMEIVIVDHGADWEIRDMYADEHTQTYNSLAELNEEWEDAPEEPKTEFYITAWGDIREYTTENERFAFKQKLEVGNYFETREEAEKAVEKLKAIQRLKNYYLKFKLDFVKNKIDFTYRLDGTLHSSIDEQRIIFEDMNLLFGGEE